MLVQMPQSVCPCGLCLFQQVIPRGLHWSQIPEQSLLCLYEPGGEQKRPMGRPGAVGIGNGFTCIAELAITSISKNGSVTWAKACSHPHREIQNYRISWTVGDTHIWMSMQFLALHVIPCFQCLLPPPMCPVQLLQRR